MGLGWQGKQRHAGMRLGSVCMCLCVRGGNKHSRGGQQVEEMADRQEAYFGQVSGGAGGGRSARHVEKGVG